MELKIKKTMKFKKNRQLNKNQKMHILWFKSSRGQSKQSNLRTNLSIKKTF